MSYYQLAMRNHVATDYGTQLPYVGALTALGTSNAAGTEPSGGSPAYARKAATWGSASASAIVGAGSTCDIPSGSTILGAGIFDASSGAPTLYDQVSITSQTFASQGTYKITPTFTAT